MTFQPRDSEAAALSRRGFLITATSAGDLTNSSSGVSSSSNAAPSGTPSNTATLTVGGEPPPPIAAIPTLSELGLIVASLLLAALAVWRLRTA